MDADSNHAARNTVNAASIDLKAIQELRDEGGDLLTELVEMFVDEVPGQLATLETALENGDAAATRLTAHRLKGTAANFGAARMETLAFAIEEKGRVGSLEGATAIFVQLLAESIRVREALEAVR